MNSPDYHAVVELRAGVVRVLYKEAGVELTVLDYDILPGVGGDDVKTVGGQPCTVKIYYGDKPVRSDRGWDADSGKTP